MMKINELKLINPYLQLPALCYQRVKPNPLNNAFVVHTNDELADELEIDRDALKSEQFLDFANGAVELEGSDNFAMCYAGHQFGFFVERLGDGRAINIGSLGRYHLQLKGAGQTLYSRGGDGRAVLRSSIREYLMSEAMYGLGIETTRALALVGSTQRVYREDWESAAMVLRVSTSWVRFGTFEYFSHHRKFTELEALADYVIAESYPHLSDMDDRYLSMFSEVVERTARLMAEWQAVGFNHGVMNTDNMSIAGLTIDYGPYAFLDDYDFRNICNHTDTYGRYSFGSQPKIGEWNLNALKRALSPLIPIEKMERVIANYEKIYTQHYLHLMSMKLGLESLQGDDLELVASLLRTLQQLSVDYTLFFRSLSQYEGEREAMLKLGLYHQPMHDWLDEYDKRLEQNNTTPQERQSQMLQTNPKYVLKNYLLQEVIEQAEDGDYSGVKALFSIAQNPYAEHPKYERWAGVTPEGFKNKKLSCSS